MACAMMCRIIAQTYGFNPVKYTEAIAFAQTEQSLLSSPSDEALKAYINVVDCSAMSAAELDKVTFANLNTRDRARAYAILTAGASGGACK